MFDLLTPVSDEAPMRQIDSDFYDDYPELRHEGAVKGGLAPWQVRRLTAWIDDNLSSTLRTTSLAALLGLSVSHFTRAFKCTVGVPPRVYVLQRRVKAACAAMLESDEALTRIAHAHGFCDQSHFTRAFQAQMGTGPQVWRRAASR